GYEREDVMAYRKIFLEQMNNFEYRMPIFLEDNLEKIIWPDNNIQRLILITHDKCIFSAYDR
ncbi:9097_t:CDS:1, partial [Funneliformis caledonium]